MSSFSCASEVKSDAAESVNFRGSSEVSLSEGQSLSYHLLDSVPVALGSSPTYE